MSFPAIRSFSSFVLFTFHTWLSITLSVDALASTDTITWGGSNDRTGYQNNHNMDPAIVGSPQFGLLYKTLLPGTYVLSGQNVPEQIFSQPLVYTDSDGVEYVYIATTQNNIYKMNAETGTLVASRNLHRPFLVSDLDGCTDINPLVGVTATGVIDPETDTWYLTSKTYLDQSLSGATGRPNGRYYIHAVNTNDLTERPHFPLNIEGLPSGNNPLKSFSGGIHHQRPGLLQYGQFVYAGFASHCAQYNFSGWIIGWDKSTGMIVEQFSTEGAGVPTSTPGGGVWMSGGGISSDDKGSMFFATGNGYASQLSNVPVNGRTPPTALEEAAVHMAINDDGSLNIVDFFMPWEKPQLDGADKDLGTTPLELLPSQFSCGNVTRMGVVTGKSGKTYWLDLDNLGGYQNGPNKLDNVLQVYQNENSVYAGAGVYPLEGGYIYINVIQYPTHVFKFSCNSGVPSFTKVADSPENNAYVLGVGHGTVTSLNDQPGTGLLWTSDVEGSNLRIYNAVPNDGLLTEINSFVTPGVTKFTRPVFGDGVVFQGTTLGYIYAYGSPVNLPLNCTSLQFGSVNINASSAAMTVQCQANTAVTVTAESLAGNANFIISGLPLPYQLAQGANLSFQAKFIPQVVGPLSSSVLLNTTQQSQGFTTITPVQLKGTGQSQVALLSVSPNTVSWNGVITGQQAGGVNQSFSISNLGNSVLQITSMKFSIISENGPWIAPNGTQVSAFTFYNLPSSIAANSAVTIPVNFNPPKSGAYAVYLQVNSNGGSKLVDFLATGSDLPHALLEFESPNGGWTRYSNNTPFSFGNVTENTSRYLRMRLSNNGDANAGAISITVSKPPFGIPGSMIGTSNDVDLAEGTLVYANQSLTATLYCSAPKSQINVDPYIGNATWTMNVNDLTFGKQRIAFVCNAVSEQAGPLNPVSQQAIYRYAGCFKENNPGRQLQTQIYSVTNNTNDMCVTQCSAAGYIFAGTQYNSQCWCGYNRPSQLFTDANCNFPCTGNVNEVCGGDGVDGEEAYISTFGDITRWNGNSTDTPGPYVNPGTLGFKSIGCYSEGTNTRALPIAPNSNDTVGGCLAACQGYAYSGVEYGGQCYCGNALGAGSVSAQAADCTMTCNNNQTEYCGGPSRLNMYIFGNGTVTSQPSSTLSSSSSPYGSLQPTQTGLSIPPIIGNFSYQSCYTEGTNGRALSGFALADDSISLLTCASNCTSYQYFGVEYGRECYCGNSLGAGSVRATDGRCTMACSGNSSLTCGGPNGLTLYKSGSSSVNASSIISSTTLSTTTSSSFILMSPTPSPVPITNFKYISCYTEATNARALTGKAVVSSDMTVEYCAGNCTGFQYMGVEYSSECYCGNNLSPGSVNATDGRCSMNCAGNSAETCGGPNGLSLYHYVPPSNTSTTASTFPTASSTPSTLATTAVSTFSQALNSTASRASSMSSTVSSGYVSSSQLKISSTTSNAPYSMSSSTTSIVSSSPVISSTSVSRNITTSLPSISTVFSSTAVSTSGSRNATSPTIIPSLTSSSIMITTSSSRNSTNSPSAPTSPPVSSTASSLMSSLTIIISSRPNLTSSASVSARIISSTRNFTTSTLSSTTHTSSGLILSSSNSSYSLPTSRLLSSSSYCVLASSTGFVTTTRSSLFTASSLATTQSMVSSRSTSTSTSAAAVSPSSRLSFTPSPYAPWTYLSCYAETNPRLISSASTSTSNMTVSQCLSFCASKDMPLAGVEYSRECYCGSTLPSSAAANQTGCTMSCPGNSSEICGGSSRLSMYNNTSFQPPQHKPVISAGSTAYKFQGCFTDVGPRTLQGHAFTTSNMTQELCVGTCQGKAFKYAGAEYATQCFCGNNLLQSSDGKGGVQTSVGDCNMKCGGDMGEWCGAGNRLSIWASV